MNVKKYKQELHKLTGDNKKMFAQMMKEFAADVGLGMRIYIETNIAGVNSLKQTIVGAVGVMKGDNEGCLISMDPTTYINKNNIIVQVKENGYNTNICDTITAPVKYSIQLLLIGRGSALLEQQLYTTADFHAVRFFEKVIDNITQVFLNQEFFMGLIFLRGYDANDDIVMSSTNIKKIVYSCINNIGFHIDKTKMCYHIQALDVERCAAVADTEVSVYMGI